MVCSLRLLFAKWDVLGANLQAGSPAFFILDHRGDWITASCGCGSLHHVDHRIMVDRPQAEAVGFR
jgi:hypothetical protein